MELPTQNSPKTYYIKIIYDPELVFEKHKHVVQPGHQYLKNGDKVIFVTKETATKIFIPKAEGLFDEPKGRWIQVDENGQSDEFVVSNECPKGKYAYVAYCDNGEDFAEGGTSPAIIVED